MVITCRIARCRIACGIARRPIASRHIPAPIGDLMSLRSSRSGKPHARRLPCPGPTAACSRRRQPLFTNMYSFVVPWRFIMSCSAARLRRIVGPLSHHVSAIPSDRTSLRCRRPHVSAIPTTARLCHPDDRTSLLCSWSGEPNARRLPCPGPTAPVTDAAPAIYEHLFFCLAVALHYGPVGGAVKARRWAAQ